MRLVVVAIAIDVVARAGWTVTIPVAVASDGLAAHRHDGPRTMDLTDEPLDPRPRDDDSTGGGDLIGVLGNDRAGPDELVDGKRRLVRTHGKESIHVDDGEVRFVEPAL